MCLTFQFTFFFRAFILCVVRLTTLETIGLLTLIFAGDTSYEFILLLIGFSAFLPSPSFLLLF